MSQIDHLSEIFGDAPWIKASACVFDYSKECGLAVAGSIARAIARKKPSVTQPGDIDLVAASENDALAFLEMCQRMLLRYRGHWRIFVNHKTEFTPPGAITHFRIQTAFWLPICVMVIPQDKFRFWFSQGGIRVQLYEITCQTADELDKRDGRRRVTEDEADGTVIVNLTDEEIAKRMRQVEPTAYRQL